MTADLRASKNNNNKKNTNRHNEEIWDDWHAQYPWNAAKVLFLHTTKKGKKIRKIKIKAAVKAYKYKALKMHTTVVARMHAWGGQMAAEPVAHSGNTAGEKNFVWKACRRKANDIERTDKRCRHSDINFQEKPAVKREIEEKRGREQLHIHTHTLSN